MKKGLSSDYIKEFYEEISKEYNLSYEECREICTTPFKMLKEIMNTGAFLDVRFKYFGLFKVSKSRLKYNLKGLEEKYSKGQISEKKYLKRKKELENGLQKQRN